MRIFVISLKGSKRRTHITNNLKSLGLNFEFFDAVNGNELSKEEITSLCDEKAISQNPQWLNPGAIGCSLSHYYIYQRILENEIERALILEDDMVINSDVVSLIDHLENRRYSDEVILLYYRSFVEARLSTSDSEELNSKYKVLHPYSLSDMPITTGCYYITNHACQILVKTILPVRVSADSWAHFIRESNLDTVKVVFPRPLEDAGFKSEIDYHSVYSSRVVRLAKKILDSLELPFVSNFLRLRRKKREKQMSMFKLVDKPSMIPREVKS